MILNRLVIYSRKDEEIKKNYKFNQVGLNIILGSKRDTDDDSNGVGKSSMVASIRYMLGSKVPADLKDRKKIEDADFMILLEVDIEKENEYIYFGRILNNPDKGYIFTSKGLTFNEDNWGTPMGDSKYKKEVEKIVLGNNDDELHPSFASIREFVIRDEKLGFNDIILPSRTATKCYEILDYLFEIEFNGENQIKKLKKDQEKLEQKLKAIELLTADITELKVRASKLKSEIDNLTNISNDLDISKNLRLSKQDYQKLKQEYNEIVNKIIKLENMKVQYKESISSLKTKVKQIKQLDDIEKFYNQIISYFPKKISKNYEEITSYYEFMVDSRGKYFGDKVNEITEMISTLEERKDIVHTKLNKQIESLKSTTIVDDINSILDRINEKNQELADINVKLEQYAEKDKISKEINEIKQEIIKQTNLKYEIFNSYKSTMEDAAKKFSDLVEVTYDEGGVLDFEFNNNTNKKNATARVKVSCKIEDENSHGRMNMKVNMFDLTWLIQRVKHKSPINFLIHDGSYVKPDNKNAKARLLKYIDYRLKKEELGQYFVTLNLDEINEVDMNYFKENKNIIAFLSKENDEDRFMGIKYV